MARLQKISIAVDPALVVDLDYIGGRMGISRSALINEMLAHAVPPMRQLLEQVPISPTPADMVRARGESAKIVADRITELQGIADDLFSR